MRKLEKLGMGMVAAVTATLGLLAGSKEALADNLMTISAVVGQTMTDGQNCIRRDWWSLRITGSCSVADVFFPLVRDDDAGSPTLNAYVRYSQEAKGLLCAVHMVSTDGTAGAIKATQRADGKVRTSTLSILDVPSPDRYTGTIYCRMYRDDHAVTAYRVIEAAP